MRMCTYKYYPEYLGVMTMQKGSMKQELTQLGAWIQRAVQHREQELKPGWLRDWQSGEGKLVKWKDSA